MQFTHIGWMADQRQRDLLDNRYYEEVQKNQHAIMSFVNDIAKLQEGTYIWDGNEWVLTNE